MYSEAMTEELISHGAIKHSPEKAATCKICQRQASKQHESQTVEPSIQPEVPQTETTTYENGKNQKTFTEEQVATMLEEVQAVTTKRIFDTLYAIYDEKQANLAGPFITRPELEALQRSYETDSQSPSGE